MKVNQYLTSQPIAEPASVARDRRRYTALQQQIAQLGFFRRGTLGRIFQRCGKSGCRCMADPPQLHGPYMQWTRKVAGKTVTVRVPPPQIELFQEWIANSRQLDRLLVVMQKISLRATERMLREVTGPKKKKASRPAATPRNVVG
jgi:hypothetical protein